MDKGAIIAGFNLAALDSSQWLGAVELLARETGSVGAALMPVDNRQFPIFAISESLAELGHAYVRDGWHQREARGAGIPVMKRTGVMTDFDCIPLDEMARHPYWQEHLAPYKLQWFAGVKIDFGPELCLLAIQRSAVSGPMPEPILKELAQLSPYLSAAGAVSAALGFAKLEGAMEAFDIARRPVIFVGRSGLVERINVAAEMLLGADLQITRGRITSFRSEATTALNRTIYEIAASNGPGGVPAMVALPRRSHLPLLAYVTCPPKSAFDILGRCRCIITIVDPEATVVVPDRETIITAFGLTPTEGDVAQYLASGRSVVETASALGMANETARSHVKAIHEKLNVRRNSELAARLAMVGGMVPSDHSD